MDNHWAVTTSSGRRVSLLCEEQSDYACSSYAPSNASSTPPPSPDYRRPYAPLKTDSIGSACSSTSSLGTISSGGLYSPRTPPSIGLPPLDKLLPVTEIAMFHPKYRADTESALPIDDALSPPQSTVVSTPSSPKTTSATAATTNGAAPPKRSSRRYACHCGKSFTTSGHLARHTRIHTGEKNYVCPEAGCTARFSRQDNCMQHYRTHQGGSGTKRAARKRRLSSTSSTTTATAGTAATTSTTTGASTPQSQQPSYIYPNYFEPFGSEGGGGLTALANIACSGYS